MNAPTPSLDPLPTPRRRFTGRHAALIVVAFFAVVIAVNVTMARYAAKTFGGTVVDNSYAAGQHFNHWLDAAAADRALGWRAGVERSGAGAVVVSLVDRAGEPVTGAKFTARAEHPLGVVPPRDVVLTEAAPGRYAGTLPAGRWRLTITASAQGHDWHGVEDVQ